MTSLSAHADSDSDDDITLQDLVALETMEDEADDVEADQFFTSLSSSTLNPLEPFMNSIIHHSGAATGQDDEFRSFDEFRRHKEAAAAAR